MTCSTSTNGVGVAAELALVFWGEAGESELTTIMRLAPDLVLTAAFLFEELVSDGRGEAALFGREFEFRAPSFPRPRKSSHAPIPPPTSKSVTSAVNKTTGAMFGFGGAPTLLNSAGCCDV